MPKGIRPRPAMPQAQLPALLLTTESLRAEHSDRKTPTSHKLSQATGTLFRRVGDGLTGFRNAGTPPPVPPDPIYAAGPALLVRTP